MYKRISLNQFLILIMMISLLLPMSVVSADGNGNGDASPTKGSLTIHKFEQESDDYQGEPDGSKLDSNPVGKPLPGVEFILTQTHSFNPETDQWTEVSGSPVKYNTNAEGKIIINDIELGRYKVKETDGPAHVNLNEEEYFVDIPMTNKEGTAVNWDVHIYPKNETIRGAVELIKIDGDSEQPIEGVGFKLYKANDEQVGTTILTDADGKIRVDNLKYGDYYFREVSTIGDYVLGNQEISFKIEESGSFRPDNIHENTVVTLTVDNYEEPGLDKEVDKSAVNRGETITYTITSDLPGDIHSYESYVITDELDQHLSYLDESWSVEGVDAEALSFTQNGQTLKWSIDNFAEFNGVKHIKISFDVVISNEAAMNISIDYINFLVF